MWIHNTELVTVLKGNRTRYLDTFNNMIVVIRKEKNKEKNTITFCYILTLLPFRNFCCSGIEY